MNQTVSRALPIVDEKRPLEFPHTPRPIGLDLSRHSLIGLRFAAIFGVGIRAAVLTELFISETERTVSELAALTAYQRRAIAFTLGALVSAGVVEHVGGAGRVHYRLANEHAFAMFAGGKPRRNTHWSTVFGTLSDVVSLARDHAERSGPGAVVAMSAILERHKSEFQRLRLKPPAWIGKPLIDARSFRHWAVGFASNTALGKGTVVRSDKPLDAADLLSPRSVGDFPVPVSSPSRSTFSDGKQRAEVDSVFSARWISISSAGHCATHDTTRKCSQCRHRRSRVPLSPESPVPRDPPGDISTVLRLRGVSREAHVTNAVVVTARSVHRGLRSSPSRRSAASSGVTWVQRKPFHRAGSVRSVP